MYCLRLVTRKKATQDKQYLGHVSGLNEDKELLQTISVLEVLEYRPQSVRKRSDSSDISVMEFYWT